ncbi:glycosyltransferase [Lutibaculum baratangense]|uniref:Putative glycosyltransferase n=1 Tax=Lutibaculum baratangense AMV1 TaxID=631454 RepID=V4RFP2_9HYPH|nr:glycosyltransferase [Lutibaculum baratangense]ESR24204.1 putative glycosyltransferase [Lutibaculum baratangense AMV1]
MADILFVHNNFPGQFGFVAQAMRDRGHRCVAIASQTGRELPGIGLLRWRSSRGTTQGIFPAATRAEADIIRGRAAVECARVLAGKGFRPKLVVGHPGWGETLFLKEVFPEAKVLLYAEYFYRSRGGDVNFDAEFDEMDFDKSVLVNAKNATLGLAYLGADRIVAPTEFQKSTLPPALWPSTTVIHEGVDLAAVRRDQKASFPLPDGRRLDATTPVVTFVNRRFEPLRGFHIMLRALPRLLETVPEAEILMIGADERGGYGKPPPDGHTWKSALLPEVEGRLDMRRVHFTGRVSPADLHAAMSISAAHVYYTYPFVMSWSLLEAMATECLIVGSDTGPVREAIAHGENGLLLDFFDVEALADTLISACREPARYAALRQAARRTVEERFDRDRLCRPRWLALIDEMLV